jgi:bacterioferritin
MGWFVEAEIETQQFVATWHLTRCLCNLTAPQNKFFLQGSDMPEQNNEKAIQDLINALNEDLSREYQAIIAYTVYSNVLKGAKWMSIAGELKKHAAEELQHALIVADQIDYLGGMPTATPKPVKLSDKPEDMIRFDLDNETETIKNYRERVRQAEALGHYALAEQLRKIISQEQEHQHDLATALGIDVPKVFSQGA